MKVLVEEEDYCLTEINQSDHMNEQMINELRRRRKKGGCECDQMWQPQQRRKKQRVESRTTTSTADSILNTILSITMPGWKNRDDSDSNSESESGAALLFVHLRRPNRENLQEEGHVSSLLVNIAFLNDQRPFVFPIDLLYRSSHLCSSSFSLLLDRGE
ncbi:hypothetical protein CDL15_Pgr001397 [Punica granatum]|uniref:Uncharacterized protein n=1 Tax=Punica granatum TaxID=22663 RepID=A0A218WL20_PUNGR|nr:hypothetical protein CDL15_Pgr001397 [Punica granatum]